MRWGLVVMVLLGACQAPVPQTVVQVPGLTPLPLAMRTMVGTYDRDEVVRGCIQKRGSPLAEGPKQQLCACMVDTALVYVTGAQVRAQNEKYGDTEEGYRAALRDRTPMSRVIMACREQVLGE